MVSGEAVGVGHWQIAGLGRWGRDEACGIVGENSGSGEEALGIGDMGCC